MVTHSNRRILLLVMLTASAMSLLAGQESSNTNIEVSDKDLQKTLADFKDLYSGPYSVEDIIKRFQNSHEGALPHTIPLSERGENGMETQPQGAAPGAGIDEDHDSMMRAVRYSTASLVGVPIASQSFFLPNRSFLITIYTFKILEVLRDKSNSLIPGGLIHVAQAGGEQMVGSIDVKAFDPDTVRFKLNTKYLFFVILIPDTNIYRAYGNSSFHMEADGSLTRLSRHLVPNKSNKLTKDDVVERLNAPNL